MSNIDQQEEEQLKIPQQKWRQRHRFLWVLGWLFSGLIGIFIVSVVGLITFINTQTGQDYLATQIGVLTGHTVEVSGLSGSFPNHLRIADIKLKDPKVGVWLSLTQTELDWSIIALLKRKMFIDRLYIKEFNVYDLPPSDENDTSDNLSLLTDVVVAATINDIQIDKLFVTNKVTPIDLAVGVKGKVSIDNVLKVAGVKTLKDLSNTHLTLHLWELNQATDLQLFADISDKNIEKSFLKINVKKQSDGLVERLLKTDQLTPINLNLTSEGPYDKLYTKLNVSVGQANLKARGYVDNIHYAMNMIIKGHSPATILNSKIGWGEWDLDTYVYGAFKSPAGHGKFEVKDLAIGDIMANKLLLQFKGKDQPPLGEQQKEFEPWVHLNLIADGLRIPGNQPKLLADSPLSLDMIYYPKEKGEPVYLQLDHKIAKVSGRIFTKPVLNGSFDIFVPELALLAKIADFDIKGSTILNMAFALPSKPNNPIDIDLDGPLMITGGMPIAVKMIGSEGHIGLHAQVLQEEIQKVILNSLNFNGKKITLNAQGSLVGEQTKGVLTVDMKDLSVITPIMKGRINAQANIDGPLQDLAAKLKVTTNFSTTTLTGYAIHPSQLEFVVNALHLPTKPDATISLTGNLDRTPINANLKAGLSEDQKKYYLKLSQMEWRSFKAVADFVLPVKKIFPIGMIKMDIARLSDISRLINQKIDGNIHLDIHTLSENIPKLIIDLNSHIAMPQLQFGKLNLSGYVSNPIEKPNVNLKLQVDQLKISNMVNGNANINMSGGLENLKLIIKGAFSSFMGSKGNIDTELTLNLLKKQIDMQRFIALAKGENIRLLSPVQAEFGEKIGLNRLRMSVAPMGNTAMMIDIAGTVKPKLALTASLQNITPGLAKPFMPDLQAKGVINAQAQLQGSLEKPQGTIRLTAQNMQLMTGVASSLPPIQLNALANLNGNTARLDTQLQAGKKINASVVGTVPLQPQGSLALQLNAKADLSVANAIIGANGQQVKGIMDMAMNVNGVLTSPVVTGNINLAKGSFRDYAQGVSINNIQASVIGQKDSIVLQSFSAKAGDGTMNANGQVGIFQPGIPVNLHFGMKNAKPLVSDLLTAVLDSDINIKGMAKTRVDVAGMVKIKRADINIPHSMSRSVVELNVIRPGEKIETVERKGFGPEIGLDLTIKSAGQILVRGFGLFTDMVGSLHIGGTAKTPQISGGFNMQNGHIDLAGITLEFTKGNIGFKGSNVDHRIDPFLDFEIKKSVEGNTVSLSLSGYASSPKIALNSSPPLSQDRVLAMLLFGVDSQSLSATQMAEIGVALATLGGEGSGFDPLGTVRKTFGLDRLSVGGGGVKNQGSTSGTTVSAGKYIMNGVYLGAKQSTGSAGTQAEIQVDITKRLKATATVGAGEDKSRFVTPDNDPGSSVGLLYKFDY